LESRTHRLLKTLAIEWLRSLGCRAVATEVACPIGRFRVDVAGWLDHAEGDALVPPPAATEPTAQPGLFEPPASALDMRRVRRRGPRRPRVILVECKQSRGDFFRNDDSREALLAERERLRRSARRIEELRIKRHEPHLRKVEAGLFEESEAWDFSATRIGAYRDVLARIERIERDLYGRSKFDLCRRYRLGDHLAVLCPRGLIRPRELPEGWGLLECDRRTLRALRDPAAAIASDTAAPEATPLRRRIDPPPLDCPEPRRLRMLRNIAVAASRAARDAGAFEA
jgi:hypothetical protein